MYRNGCRLVARSAVVASRAHALWRRAASSGGLEALRARADAGDTSACLQYANAVKDDNYAEATAYYRKAAQAGSADAMFALGRACLKQYNQHLGGPQQESSPSTAEDVVAQIRQARKENLRKKKKRERGEHVLDEHAAKFEHLVEALDWLQAAAKANHKPSMVLLANVIVGDVVRLTLEAISRAPNSASNSTTASSATAVRNPLQPLPSLAETLELASPTALQSSPSIQLVEGAQAVLAGSPALLSSISKLLQTAVDWYTVAAQPPGPHTDALFNLGQLFYDGDLVAADWPRSFQHFLDAAQLGDPSAEYWVGYCLLRGEGGATANVDEGLRFLNRAAEKGHGQACFYLAQLYRSGNADELQLGTDPALFWKYLQMGVKHEDPDCIFALADLYFHGTMDTKKDQARAVSLYRWANDLGHAQAALVLGAIHYNGVLGERDLEQAFEFYQTAAERGSIDGWKHVAAMYMTGEGVPQNEQLARQIISMIRKSGIER